MLSGEITFYLYLRLHSIIGVKVSYIRETIHKRSGFEKKVLIQCQNDEYRNSWKYRYKVVKIGKYRIDPNDFSHERIHDKCMSLFSDKKKGGCLTGRYNFSISPDFNLFIQFKSEILKYN